MTIKPIQPSEMTTPLRPEETDSLARAVLDLFEVADFWVETEDGTIRKEKDAATRRDLHDL